MRLFVGIPLSEEARRGIVKAVKKIRRGHWLVKWQEPEKWHVTLAFLGEVKKERVKEVVEAVSRGVEAVEAFEVRFKGWGGFPDWLLPRVIWLGLKGDLKSMARLQKRVRQELEEKGLEFDKKPFKGHMTLGRVKPEMKRKQRLELGKYLKKKRELEIPQKWWVDKVEVYESRLKTEGAEYKVVASVKLSLP